MTTVEPLKFRVHPHIVEDLGLNLYTDLPRVLVEFVANAHDADSPHCHITLDFDQITEERKLMKAAWEIERKEDEIARLRNESVPERILLDERTLPENVTIVVEDRGHGMSRADLEEKFLVAGRRRRNEDPNGARSEGGRIVMGRKGLGKLAGFGVAHRVEVVSRRKGEAHATKVTLEFEELLKHRATEDIRVPTEQIDDGGGIEPHGTRITLSRLAYDPVKSRNKTIAHEIGDHFAFVDSEEFAVLLNGDDVTPTPREFAYAFPHPDRDKHELVDHTLQTEDGRDFKFKYRLRFTPPKHNLPARERGVRVYAHKRLASAPDLLDAPTGMHGFRLTDYLDGVVEADFIDEQPAEYIATDRQSLRWEVPLLTPLRKYLSNEIRRACESYQKFRDAEGEREARTDEFTKNAVEGKKLPPYKQRIAYKIAGELINHLPGGKEANEYKQQLQILMDGLGQGTVLQAVSDLAKEDSPDFNRVVARAIDLTESEVGEFLRFVEGRLDAITALRKICRDVNFRAAKNEKELHRLFNRAPWLIESSFNQYLVSDESVHTLFSRLATHLEIGPYATSNDPSDERRPDLVFVLGNKGEGRVVIVELKAPNVPLSSEHLDQLRHYMIKASRFLRETSPSQEYRVEGYLIGSMPNPESRAVGAELLRDAVTKMGPSSDTRVMDILEVLDRTERAHNELLTIYERVARVDHTPTFDEN